MIPVSNKVSNIFAADVSKQRTRASAVNLFIQLSPAGNMLVSRPQGKQSTYYSVQNDGYTNSVTI